MTPPSSARTLLNWKARSFGWRVTLDCASDSATRHDGSCNRSKGRPRKRWTHWTECLPARVLRGAPQRNVVSFARFTNSRSGCANHHPRKSNPSRVASDDEADLVSGPAVAALVGHDARRGADDVAVRAPVAGGRQVGVRHSVVRRRRLLRRRAEACASLLPSRTPRGVLRTLA